jgi:hypothetical protein
MIPGWPLENTRLKRANKPSITSNLRTPEREADTVRVATSLGNLEQSSNVQRFKHLRSDQGGRVPWEALLET